MREFKNLININPSCKLSKPAPQIENIYTFPNWVNHLFFRFSLIYQEKWTAALSADPNAKQRELLINYVKNEWATDIYLKNICPKIIDAVIERATDICKNKEPWPPTIAVFVKYAKEAKSEIDREIEQKEYLRKMQTAIAAPIEENEIKQKKYIEYGQEIMKKIPNIGLFDLMKLQDKYMDSAIKIKNENLDYTWDQAFELARI